MTSDPGAQTRSEIAEQPRMLREVVARRDELAALAGRVRPDPLRGVVLVARGSSDNAAVYGRYVLELAAGVPVALAAPSLQTRYGATPSLEGFLAVAVSQSGHTPEIVACTERLRAGGATALAITNTAGSPLADAADVAVELGTGPEEAVPATKTFTAQLAAFALLAEALAVAGGAGAPGWTPAWPAALDAVDAVVADPAPAGELAPALLAADRVVPMGRGLLYAAALEAALKLAETTGRAVHAFSPADLLHGPIAAVGEGTLVVCFAADGPVLADLQHAAAAAGERGAALALVGDRADLVADAGAWLAVPAGVAEGLAALPQVVRAQQLAERAAVAAGIDPDRPFGLSKITETR